MLNRTIAPDIHHAVEFDLPLKPYEFHQLNNQVPVYLINGGTQEVFELCLAFPAGSWYEKQNLIAQAVGALLKNGTSAHTALELNELIEYYGASLKVQVSHEHAMVNLHGLTRHLTALLPVLYEIVADATFPASEVELFNANRKQQLAVSLRKSDFVATRLIDAYLYGKDHPYGRYSNMEDYDQVTSASLHEFYKRHYASNRCKIFFSGKVDASHVAELNKVFGAAQWNEQPEVARPVFEIAPVAEKHHRVINDETGVQGAVRVARLFPARPHPDFAPMIVLNTVMGGYFGSRLMSNIREEKGYTYGIYSAQYNLREHSALNIQTDAGRDVCEATITEVFKELDDLKEQLIDEEELLLVKNYLLGNMLGDLDGPFQIAQRWRNLILNGFDADLFYRNIEIYKSVTPEALLELARKYYNREDFYELIVV
jgi:predicted Zn-dependent peptidase